MKRILYIIPTLHRAGAQQQMLHLAAAMSASCDVHVVALDARGELADALENLGVGVSLLERRWFADPLALCRLIDLVRFWQPEVIHSFRRSAHFFAYCAARFGAVPRFLMTQHRREPGAGRLRREMDRFATRRAAAVVVNSAADAPLWTRDGWPGDRLYVVPNGLPPAEPMTTTRGQLLAELGLPATARLIGAAGGLREQKRLKDLIWATDLLQVIRDDVHLLLFGEGPHAERLRRFAQQANVGGLVHFLGVRSDLPRWLPHLDVFWSASAYEGHARSLLEAMSAGCPVVATDIPGTREIVVPGETGQLVPVGDRAGFARHTHELLDDPAQAARLGEAGRQRVATHFSVDAMIARYRTLYDTSDAARA